MLPTLFEFKQVQLILELCDRGSLRAALSQRVFFDVGASGSMRYLTMLETAADVARGMQHLHASNILHSDLKVRGEESGRECSSPPWPGPCRLLHHPPLHLALRALNGRLSTDGQGVPPPSCPWTYRHLHNPSTFALQALNVLLQSNPDAAKGFTAKVADFGLSVQMSKAETHVSGLYQVGRMEEEGRVGGDEIWETGWCVDWVRWLGRKASPTSRVAGWYLLLSQVSLYCPYDLCGRGRPLHSLVSLFMH